MIFLIFFGIYFFVVIVTGGVTVAALIYTIDRSWPNNPFNRGSKNRTIGPYFLVASVSASST
jgi:hypothetical protein